MTCEELVGLLVDLVEDDLDQETRDALHRHCELCPPCGGFRNTYALTRELTELALGRSLPEEARQRIEAELRARLTGGA